MSTGRKSLQEIFMPAFKISQSPKHQSNERFQCQLRENHFGRYSCPHSKAPKARSVEVTRGFHVNQEKITSGDIHAGIQKYPESLSVEVTRGFHVNQEKITLGDFHANIPKSQRFEVPK
jgi:hypothetical protein